MDKTSYALGMSIAHNMIQSGVRDLVLDDFTAAIQDAFKGKEPAVPFEEAGEILNKYFEEAEKAKAAEAAEIAGKMKEEGVIEVVTSQRSAVESRKYDACHRVETVFKLGGGKVRHSDGYQGWAPNKNSKILKTAVKIWSDLYGVEPKVEAIHAGLECGLFLKALPTLDMISYGPTLLGVHSPSERCHIPAVQKSWDFTLGIIDAVAKEK